MPDATKRRTARLNRRHFLALAGGASASLALPGCGPTSDAARYDAADIAKLAAQRQLERVNSGTGPYGPLRFRGYRGLADLPWFELASDGTLRLTADEVPAAIDFHCHLGMSMLFAPEIDLQQKTERVLHLLDCDATDPGCELDLDIYINGNFTEDDLSAMQRGVVSQAFLGSEAAASQTIPNLLAEMDATRVEQAVVLPIAFGLPFGDDVGDRWHRGIEAAEASQRLLLGASVHPDAADRIPDLERQAARGARIVKLHPTMQRFYPDEERMMEIYAACERLGMAVFFHCGRAGIEPERTQPYGIPRHYEGALANFPNLQFILGHGGARDAADALDLALRYDNAWLGVHGQSVTNLDEMLRRTGGERLLFGTDWPFYHLAASLAKVLIVTRDAPELRHAVLRGNAAQLLG
jgi:predicted TIM-barrel fold metal-dependent hydrolase